MLDKDIKTANLKNINSYLSELLEGQDLNFCNAASINCLMDSPNDRMKRRPAMKSQEKDFK